MSIVVILGIPENLKDSEALNDLTITQLPAAVAKIPELYLEAPEIPIFVPVHMPEDLVVKGAGVDIMAVVKGPFQPQLPKGVLSTLANTVLQVIKEFAEKQELGTEQIQVFVESVNLENEGYALWKKEGA